MPADLNTPFSESCCDGGNSNPNDRSARSCGCDPGAKWVCQRHQDEDIILKLIYAAEEASRSLNRPRWLETAISNALKYLERK